MRTTCWTCAFLCVTTVFAQSTTPYIQLQLPAYNSPNWNVPLINNFNLIDQYLGGQKPLPGNLRVTGNIMGNFTITATQISTALGNQLPLLPLNNFSDIGNAATALVNLGALGPGQYQGAWSSTVSYSLGQVVTYSGGIYKSLAGSNTGNTPSTSLSQWGLLFPSGSPAAGNCAVQFSNGGIFAGDATNLCYNQSTYALTVGGALTAATVSLTQTGQTIFAGKAGSGPLTVPAGLDFAIGVNANTKQLTCLNFDNSNCAPSLTIPGATQLLYGVGGTLHALPALTGDLSLNYSTGGSTINSYNGGTSFSPLANGANFTGVTGQGSNGVLQNNPTLNGVTLNGGQAQVGFAVGTGGVQANTFCSKSGAVVSALSTTSTGAYGVCSAAAAATSAATYAPIRYGWATITIDGAVTVNDLLGISNTTNNPSGAVAGDGHDLGTTSSGSVAITTRIMGSAITAASAPGQTVIIDLTPDHFGTLVSGGTAPTWCPPYSCIGSNKYDPLNGYQATAPAIPTWTISPVSPSCPFAAGSAVVSCYTQTSNGNLKFVNNYGYWSGSASLEVEFLGTTTDSASSSTLSAPSVCFAANDSTTSPQTTWTLCLQNPQGGFLNSSSTATAGYFGPRLGFADYSYSGSGNPYYSGTKLLLNKGYGLGSVPINHWKITYSASAIKTFAVGSSGGTGYVVGDVVVLTQSGCAGAQAQVTGVSSGVVTGVAIIPGVQGTGCSAASNLPTTGGTGTGLTITTTIGNLLAFGTSEDGGQSFEWPYTIGTAGTTSTISVGTVNKFWAISLDGQTTNNILSEVVH